MHLLPHAQNSVEIAESGYSVLEPKISYVLDEKVEVKDLSEEFRREFVEYIKINMEQYMHEHLPHIKNKEVNARANSMVTSNKSERTCLIGSIIRSDRFT